MKRSEINIYWKVKKIIFLSLPKVSYVLLKKSVFVLSQCKIGLLYNILVLMSNNSQIEAWGKQSENVGHSLQEDDNLETVNVSHEGIHQ